MSVADVVLARLRAAGVPAIFGVPGGGGNLDLIDAARRVGVPFVLTATETGAALAALAQAEITGRPAACLTTLGPGAASVVNGVACAFLDRAPLVVFTDTQANAAFAHQRLDHAALLRSITKWSATLSPENPGGIIDEAIARALAPPAGPVHIDCPGDLGAPVADAAQSPARAGASGPAAADWNDPSRACDLVRAARRPLLVVGLDARDATAAAAIRGFCRARRVPALVTYKAKGIVPDGDEWFGGVFTLGAIERPIVDESDLVIGVGLDPVELLPRPWTIRSPILSCGPIRYDDGHVPFAAQLVGDIAAGLRRIEVDLGPSTWDSHTVRAHAATGRASIHLPAPGLTAGQVVETTARRLGPVAGRVTVDAGAHMLPATLLWPVDAPNTLLISNGLSTMGFALPAAIGAALVDRTRPVVALTGDGGLLMCVGELVTAVRERLRVIVVVFADDSLSLIEIKQAGRRLSPSGVSLPPVDWCTLAKGLGVAAFAASTVSDLDRAAAAALDESGPALIEARIDRSNYAAMLKVIRG
jgi:acetolactate synthase-1/2/3 large subunit